MGAAAGAAQPRRRELTTAENRGVPGSSPGLAISRSACDKALLHSHQRSCVSVYAPPRRVKSQTKSQWRTTRRINGLRGYGQRDAKAPFEDSGRTEVHRRYGEPPPRRHHQPLHGRSVKNLSTPGVFGSGSPLRPIFRRSSSACNRPFRGLRFVGRQLEGELDEVGPVWQGPLLDRAPLREGLGREVPLARVDRAEYRELVPEQSRREIAM
jgi:hypothetical protein